MIITKYSKNHAKTDKNAIFNDFLRKSAQGVFFSTQKRRQPPLMRQKSSFLRFFPTK
jgi:hypothetical protein